MKHDPFALTPASDEMPWDIIDDLTGHDMAESQARNAISSCKTISQGILGIIRDAGFRIKSSAGFDAKLQGINANAQCAYVNRSIQVKRDKPHSLVHEIGHAVMYAVEVLEGYDDTSATMQTVFESAVASGEIKKFGLFRGLAENDEYVNRDEYFAESFAAYHGLASNACDDTGASPDTPRFLSRSDLSDQTRALIEDFSAKLDVAYHDLHQRFSVDERSGLITTPGRFYARDSYVPYMFAKALSTSRYDDRLGTIVNAYERSAFPALANVSSLQFDNDMFVKRTESLLPNYGALGTVKSISRGISTRPSNDTSPNIKPIGQI